MLSFFRRRRYRDAALDYKLDLILENQERIMAAIDNLKSILSQLHETIRTNLEQQNATLQKIADANTENDSAAIADLVASATQDNADLIAATNKSKAALAGVKPDPAPVNPA